MARSSSDLDIAKVNRSGAVLVAAITAVSGLATGWIAGRATDRPTVAPAHSRNCIQEFELLQADVWKALGQYDAYAETQKRFSEKRLTAAEARDEWIKNEAAMAEIKKGINRNLDTLKRCK